MPVRAVETHVEAEEVVADGEREAPALVKAIALDEIALDEITDPDVVVLDQWYEVANVVEEATIGVDIVWAVTMAAVDVDVLLTGET